LDNPGLSTREVDYQVARLKSVKNRKMTYFGLIMREER